MFLPGDPRFDELLTLSQLASTSGLHDQQRPRWRELCGQLLGTVNASLGAIGERRKALRASARLPVHLLSPDEIQGLSSSSVSSGGLSIPTHNPLLLGTLVEMSIQIEGRATPLFVSGRVVWAIDDAMGVVFTDLVQSDREQLEAVAVRSVLARLAAE